MYIFIHCRCFDIIFLFLAWQERYPPNSIPINITAPQLVTIQEKSVSASEFEWGPETDCFAARRTEIQFMEGESCVQTNLPLLRNQEVYHWEAKMFDKPNSTIISVGVATKRYPSRKLPGKYNKICVVLYNDI